MFTYIAEEFFSALAIASQLLPFILLIRQPALVVFLFFRRLFSLFFAGDNVHAVFVAFEGLARALLALVDADFAFACVAATGTG